MKKIVAGAIVLALALLAIWLISSAVQDWGGLFTRFNPDSALKP